MPDLLNSIVVAYERQYPWLPQQRGKWPDRRGEYWGICVFHGDREPGSFSFSERGYKCFACDAKGGLRALAETMRIVDGYQPIPLRRKAKPKPIRTWTPAWLSDPDPLARFEPLPPIALDYCHKRGLTDKSIQRWRIGYGVLPASRCHVPRLIIPVIENGCLVGLRGRAVLPEDQDEKWLQSAGSKTTLFGLDTLGQGRTVIVTEAPLSAILAMQESDVAAVAGTAGASCWKPEWTAAIAAAKPAWALAWFDCDDTGQRNGIKVVNQLLAAGIRARLYRWPEGTPDKHDLADVVRASRCG